MSTRFWEQSRAAPTMPAIPHISSCSPLNSLDLILGYETNQASAFRMLTSLRGAAKIGAGLDVAGSYGSSNKFGGRSRDPSRRHHLAQKAGTLAQRCIAPVQEGDHA